MTPLEKLARADAALLRALAEMVELSCVPLDDFRGGPVGSLRRDHVQQALSHRLGVVKSEGRQS